MPPAIRRIATALCLTLLGLAPLAPTWAATPWRNTRNRPFAAVSNGPQGAIVVSETTRPAEQPAASRDARIRAAIAAQHPAQGYTQATQAMRFLRERGIAGPQLKPRFPRTIVHALGGRPILPDLERTQQVGAGIGDPGNTLHFEFVGWPAADKAALQGYLEGAMSVALSVYGPPAFDITVKIIRDESLRVLQGGTYDVTTNELRLPPLSGNFPEDTFVLLMLVLNAFHDDVALFYDSWEQGMIGAAATAIQIAPGVSPGYDPANPGPFYSGSVYEPQNQPALGNSTWFPTSGFSGMLVWRIAQARAAWFKCSVEDESFFARFNAQYYARLNALPAADRAALAGDTPSLVEACETVLPRIEGLRFFAWYRQQYALDTSVTVGLKMFTWNIPLADAVALIVEHYDTWPTGNESPNGGTAHANYFNYNFTLTLFAQEGNEIVIPSTGDAAGEGFLIPTFFNVGGPQRITVQIDLNGLFAQYPFPYGVRGFDPGENNLYGALIGPTEGTIDVTGLDGLSDVQVQRGVWGGVVSKNAMSPGQLTVTITDADGNSITRKVNVAFDTYCVLAPAGAQGVVSKHFPVGANGLYLMSVPVLPTTSDPADALGLDPARLLLARWKPNAPGGGKYEIYPAIEPFRPGLGYWFRAFSDTTVAVEGIIAPSGEDVVAPLYAGWNMVGCARNTGVDVADLMVRQGSADTLAFAEAVSSRWVQGGVWSYDQTSGYGATARLQPFAGYWLRCLLPAGASLIFPAAGSTASSAERIASAAADEPAAASGRWRLRFLLQCGEWRGEATMGAGPRATDGYDALLDLQSPPLPAVQPALRFRHPEWGANAGDYLTDTRDPASRGPWRLTAMGIPAGARAVLRWSDTSGLPAGLQPTLTNRQTGRTVALPAARSHSFRGTGADYAFDISLR